MTLVVIIDSADRYRDILRLLLFAARKLFVSFGSPNVNSGFRQGFSFGLRDIVVAYLFNRSRFCRFQVSAQFANPDASAKSNFGKIALTLRVVTHLGAVDPGLAFDSGCELALISRFAES